MTIQSRTSEQERLTAAREQGVPCRKWGPYLSERQWGTVREDYSDLASIFTQDAQGQRPVHGGAKKFQEDPHWRRDLVLFYEYFHGDNAAGLGASHQTGWTGIVARAMHLFATSTSQEYLELGKIAGLVEVEPASTRPTGSRTSQGGKG